MLDPVDELKTRAEILQHSARDLVPAAVERLRALAELRKAEADALQRAAASVQRKHCLTVVAREAGFTSWDHALSVLDGDGTETDFGRLLYSDESGGFLNQWFATYDEARAAQREGAGDRGYLLAYQRHFFIVLRQFIEALGLDPDDPDWAAIDWDWARPKNPAARRRLYGKVLAAKRRD